MASRTTSTPKLGAALCLVLGMGIALSTTPGQAQSAAPGATATSQGSSDLDTNFWLLVRDSNDPDAVQSYLYSFPTGKYAEVARDRLASLREQVKSARATPGPSGEDSMRTPEEVLSRTSPSSIAPTPAASPPPAEQKELALSLQRELKRVGCLGGEADGVWGDQSRAGLKSFVRHANLSIAGEEPNLAALDAASARRARVCPLVCDNDEKVVGDRCVPVQQNKPHQARREPVQERRQEPRRQAAPRESYNSGNSGNSGKKLCFGGGRNELVACQ